MPEFTQGGKLTLSPLRVTKISFLLAITPAWIKHEGYENKRDDYQLKKLLFLNKFSLSES